MSNASYKNISKLEKDLLSTIHVQEKDVCQLECEEREGIKYCRCITAASVRGMGDINRYNELRSLKCPDLAYVCPYKSGKFIPENHTHIHDAP